MVMSIALATALAAPLGLILGQSPRLDRLAAPFIYLLYPIPKVVLVPIVLLFLGLGYYIYVQGSTLFDYPRMYAGVVAMSILGLGLYFSVDAAERHFCRWRSAR